MPRIIVADDDHQVRDLLRQILEGDGHEVLEASDGAEALDHLRGGCIDLLITDIIMPGKGGIELLRVMRKKHPDVRTIAVSGGGELINSRDFLQVTKLLGVRQTLAKPFSPAAILTAVADELGCGPMKQ